MTGLGQGCFGRCEGEDAEHLVDDVEVQEDRGLGRGDEAIALRTRKVVLTTGADKHADEFITNNDWY